MRGSKPKQAIAIAEWNWTGHHPAFFNHFRLALEELGFDVLAICPDLDEVSRQADQPRCHSAAAMPDLGRTHFRRIAISSDQFRRNRSGGFKTIFWTVRFFRSIENQVREWSRQTGQRVKGIFYCCIYDWEFRWMHLAHPFLSLPWAGLYVHARSYRMPNTANPVSGIIPRPELMFRGRLCKSIAILDEGIREAMSEHIGKPVIAVPEITDERLEIDSEGATLGKQLEQFAAGRPIVGLFGHLAPSKGIKTFLAGAKKSDPAKVCFALVGARGWPDEDDQEIRRTLNECPNIWSHLHRIPDEAHLNYLISKCQVLFAAYLDFPHSSGIISKAALLEKPLVISDGYLMAERSRRFHLGEVIPQASPDAFLDAVYRISQKPEAWIAVNQPKWVEYRRENSFGCFKQRLSELVAHM